ncbi:MAG: DUF5011 domain-containing protein [Thaumarchaeota archaeon]|nr:MAG: DUF5011 domain-containing protein [Nitrososphaerota archaeon]
MLELQVDRAHYITFLSLGFLLAIILVPFAQADAVVNQFKFVVSNIAYQSSISNYGANVGYTVTATSNGTPVSTLSCNPPSGSQFPVGNTAVTCIATDSQSNSVSDSFIITVSGTDSVPPTIVPPANVAATATGTYTNVALGKPTVTDNADTSPLVTNDAPAAGFPVGITTVTWTATDHSGNSATATQQVTVSPGGTTLTVSASPSGGLYNSAQSVTLTASAPSTIYYTKDGTTPTTSSTNGPSPVSGISISTSTTLKFFAKDTAGNSGTIQTASYTVDTVAPAAPVITTLSSTTNNKTPTIAGTAEAGSSIQLFDGSTPLGSPATATGGSWSITVSVLSDGAHVITAKATDIATNTSLSSASITITVDTVAPVITRNGPSPISVAVGSTYTDAGATATDNVDGDITSSIVTVNPVNTALIGTYTVTYDVKNAAGNPATQVARTVRVIHTGTPIIYMQDTIASAGQPAYSGKPIYAEYVTGSSMLVGKQIDTILVKLKKGGLPTGTATIGVFNTDLSVKGSFGTIDVSTIATSYTDYTFSLPTSAQPYLIQAGDRIGIKFAGGDASNFVSIMTDRTNAFDSANAYRTTYGTGWTDTLTDDIYMTLKLANIYS